MAAVELALVEHQNYIHDGRETYVYPGGLAFYFVIYPAPGARNAASGDQATGERNASAGERNASAGAGEAPGAIRPAIRQHQNFIVDGEPYWRNTPGAYDSFTVVYNEHTFEEQEPRAASRIALRRNAGAFIQKTVICGPPLPPRGQVAYPLFFGFGQTLEVFDFSFNLQDIPRTSAPLFPFTNPPSPATMDETAGPAPYTGGKKPEPGRRTLQPEG
jgi:hypothetical protein